MNCDRQTTGENIGEVYCSQTCRLADPDTSFAGSEPTSPTNIRTFPSSSLRYTPASSRFALPPAFDFSAYRSTLGSNTNTSSRPTSMTMASTNNISIATPSMPLAHLTGFHILTASTLPAYMTRSYSETPSRHLTPSSSRSSLASVSNASAQAELISYRARIELRDYTNSFDPVRDWRRRKASS